MPSLTLAEYLDTSRQLTRADLKALPVSLLASNRYGCAPGDVSLLSFARHTKHMNRLYALMPELRDRYRTVAGDSPRAFLVERHLRHTWSRLVDQSRGYYRNARGRFEYAQ